MVPFGTNRVNNRLELKSLFELIKNCQTFEASLLVNFLKTFLCKGTNDQYHNYFVQAYTVFSLQSRSATIVDIKTFGQAPDNQRIWLDGVNCKGNESNIALCEHNGWGAHNCGHTEDLALRCSPRTGNSKIFNLNFQHSCYAVLSPVAHNQGVVIVGIVLLLLSVSVLWTRKHVNSVNSAPWYPGTKQASDTFGR